MKKFLLGVLIGFVFCGLALVILFFAAVRFTSRPPSIPESSILVYKLSGSPPETPQLEIPIPFFQRMSPPTMRDHWELLRKAAADSRIRAILFEPEGVDAGWARLAEIRADIMAFKKSGKPVYAFLRGPGAREYYLAAAADRIYMTPEDYLDVKGLRAELMYLKGTLDKLGINVQIAHAGKYKDAGDMFTRTSMSPETREVMNSVVDDLYGQLIGGLASARKKTPEQMRDIINEGPFISTQARDAGLVDGLEYRDQVLGDLRARIKVPKAAEVSSARYLRVPAQSVGVETGSRIAFIVAEGDIIRGDSDSLVGGQGFVTVPAMTRLIEQVRSDPGIRGVVLRIDSPGGDGFASDEIWRQVSLLSKAKPLVISMSDMAASGGYYMAMTGDPILAYPGTFTGSIGVFYGKADLHGLYQKLGIQKDIISRGRFADIDSDYTPLTQAGFQKLQFSIEQFYKSFVDLVSKARRRPYAEINAVAQGRVWLGNQAIQNGLVDRMGGIDHAIETVKQRAGIPQSEKVRLVPYPAPRSIWDELFGGPSVQIPDSELLSVLRRYSTRTWMRGGILKMMPYRIEVR